MLFVKKIITSVGDNITIDENANITKYLVIGDFLGIRENCMVEGDTVIGKYVMMG